MGRNQAKLSELKKQLGERCSYTVGDVRNTEDCAATYSEAKNAMGCVDVLINNAGEVRFTPIDLPIDQAIEDFEAIWRVNTRAPFVLSRLVMAHMIERGEGHIINIATDHIHTCGFPVVLSHDSDSTCQWAASPRRPVGAAAFDVYDSSKWGIKGITNAWARDLAPQKIRVNSFGMGATITPMFLSVLGDRPLPPGTMQADEVAGLIVELVAEGPDGRTGDDVQVWAGHPTVLPPVGLEGRLTLSDLVGKN
jgi:3alpha(or 20beta)-hydroxysteroid dehydrogenase